MCCRYNSKLHGTVFEDVGFADDPSLSSEPSSRPVQGLHIMSYNLKLIESFVARAGINSAATEQRNAVEKLDSRLSSIAHREVWHTLSH